MTNPRPASERFWMKVDPCRTDGCAIWLGAKSDGYGYFNPEGRIILAHHFLIGKPEKGKEWDHLCRVTDCIWPDHLELVTHQVNTQRGLVPQRNRERAEAMTHCKNGHARDETNIRVWGGQRRCRGCIRARYMAKKAGANA